jgi:hypothetical protein
MRGNLIITVARDCGTGENSTREIDKSARFGLGASPVVKRRGRSPEAEDPNGWRRSSLAGARELSRAASSGSLFLRSLEFAKAAAEKSRAIALVEGASDQLAVTALAKRLGKDLEAEGIVVVAMGGATNIGYFLDLLGPSGLDAKTAGLYDAGEERHIRRALERAGFGLDLARSDMEELGFYLCEADLEDELIRAVGVEWVLKVIAAQGELEPFHTFQRQQAWHDRGEEAQLRRWLGVKTLRKFRYAALLVDALDLDRVPPPLSQLLCHLSNRH